MKYLYCFVLLLLLSSISVQVLAQESQNESTKSLFFLGITDGNIFNGLSGLKEVVNPVVNTGSYAPFGPSRTLNLSIQFSRFLGRYKLSLSHLTSFDSGGNITGKLLALDFGRILTNGNFGPILVEGGLILSRFIRIGARLGIESNLKLYKKLHLCNKVMIYSTFAEGQFAVMYTTGFSYIW